MTVIPEYLLDQTEQNIMNRILSRIPDDIDKSEGSYIWDAVAPVAAELAMAAVWVQEMLRRGFAQTTFGPYLDLRADESGITRRPAVPSVTEVLVTGVEGTLIPSGTRFAAPADPTSGSPAVQFYSTGDVTIGESESSIVPVTAVVPGRSGIVPAGVVTMLVDRISGVKSVTNPAPSRGGVDQEDDESLLARLLQAKRTPSAGGNTADYIKWAGEVIGVGGVSVLPIEDGNGSVNIYIVGTDKKPAPSSLVDSVQNYIAPPRIVDQYTSDFMLSGAGVSIESDVPGAHLGKAVKMLYDVSGDSMIRDPAIKDKMKQPGTWTMTANIKVSDATGTNVVVEMGMWNVSSGGWASMSPSSLQLKPSDLSLSFTKKSINFYWNGQDNLEWRVIRKSADTTTVVHVDNVNIRSTFSTDSGDAKAPIGAVVSVRPAIPVSINVTATVVIAQGYDPANVRSAIVDNLAAYIKSIAFVDDNDVRWSNIGKAIIDTTGVADYTGLQVNGSTANISISAKEVAVLGMVSLS